MAKRFTTTDKYKTAFFRSLPGAYKLLWDYICNDCDYMGIWIVDFEIAKIYLGEDIDVNKNDALRYFNLDKKRVVEFDKNKKWFISSFIFFQYGKILNMGNPVHASILKHLKTFSFIDIMPHKSPSHGDKDIDKEKKKYLITLKKGDSKGEKIMTSNRIKRDVKIKKKEKKKQSIPELSEFIRYAKEVLKRNKLNYSEYSFTIKTKYSTWVEAGWKDGHGNVIKNWKLKFNAVVPYLKPIYVPGTKNKTGANLSNAYKSKKNTFDDDGCK